MSQGRKGVPWTCPDCGREYQLSPDRELPDVCKQCRRRNEKAERTAARAAGRAEPPSMESAAAAPVNVFKASSQLPATAEAHVARQEREQLMEYVANISRTMTFFRRLVWALVIVMLLNFLLMGGVMFYSMRQLSSVGGLLDGNAGAQQPGGVVVQPGGGAGQVGGQLDNLPPALRERLKPVEDYYGQVNDLLNEMDGGGGARRQQQQR